MAKTTLYTKLVREIAKMQAGGEPERFFWGGPVLERIEGSGILDMMVDMRNSRKPNEKIVLLFAYDHMDESGSYTGASNYRATITPSRGSISVKVTGKHADIRACLEDTLLDKLTN